MNIKIRNGMLTVDVNIYDLIEELSKDERRELAEALTWNEIMEEAARRMIGESECSGGEDDTIALDFLCKMEDRLQSGYVWSWLKDLNELSREMVAHEHLYWKMRYDPVHAEFFHTWLKVNNIKSQYTSEFKEHKELVEFVEETLRKFANKDGEK